MGSKVTKIESTCVHNNHWHVIYIFARNHNVYLYVHLI